MPGLDIPVISNFTRYDLLKFLTVILYFQKNVETYESIPMPTVTQTIAEPIGLAIWGRQLQPVVQKVHDTPHIEAVKEIPSVLMHVHPHSTKKALATPG